MKAHIEIAGLLPSEPHGPFQSLPEAGRPRRFQLEIEERKLAPLPDGGQAKEEGCVGEPVGDQVDMRPRVESSERSQGRRHEEEVADAAHVEHDDARDVLRRWWLARASGGLGRE